MARHAQYNATPIHAQGRVVGHVRGEVFYKTAHSSRHMWRWPPAWAFDVASIGEAEAAGARFVEVFDKDTGTVYRASIAAIRQKGFSLNRGYGQQVALPLPHWETARAAKAEQLALFSGV